MMIKAPYFMRAICVFDIISNTLTEKSRGDAGIWTRGLLHAKQALYRWATSPMSENMVLNVV